MPPHSHHDQHEHHQPGHHHHEHGPSGAWGWILSLFHLGGHDHRHGAQSLVADDAFASSQAGIRTIWIALGLLGATTLFQMIIYLIAGSVALLADTVHNLGDALNTLPLLLAFRLAGRAANRRYTYGYHRAEDVAGVIIVLSIAFSAGYVFWESFHKFVDPEPIRNLGAVAAAAVIGFLGNEAVAIIQIRTGRQIGSAALVTDGLHARTDGLTSLAVLIAAGGSWLGFPLVDPIVGLIIGVAILFITRDAVVSVWYRLMDAIEPELYDQAEQAVQRQIVQNSEIKEIRRLRLRWLGHRLNADLVLAVDPQLTTAQSHHLAEQVRHGLFEAMPLLTEAITHVEPWDHGVEKYHSLTAKREPVPKPIADD